MKLVWPELDDAQGVEADDESRHGSWQRKGTRLWMSATLGIIGADSNTTVARLYSMAR